MLISRYQVTFKLSGGATVTKIITASNETEAGSRASKIFKATSILSIRKV